MKFLHHNRGEIATLLWLLVAVILSAQVVSAIWPESGALILAPWLQLQLANLATASAAVLFTWLVIAVAFPTLHDYFFRGLRFRTDREAVPPAHRLWASITMLLFLLAYVAWFLKP